MFNHQLQNKGYEQKCWSWISKCLLQKKKNIGVSV